ncbi:hypothetical protein ACFO4L_02445 [Bacillus daqingensis]|uniref:Uncharacterized protein n=1 Tax=Bacillus daqingensis TaxID=872396 RepID=A0ABV9NTR2_9BACI
MWINDLILVLIGFALGIVSAGPLKNIWTGKWKEDARQNKRVKLLSALQQEAGYGFTAEELNQRVFNRKLDEADVIELLKEIAESNLIYYKANKWYFSEHTHRKHQRHYRH